MTLSRSGIGLSLRAGVPSATADTLTTTPNDHWQITYHLNNSVDVVNLNGGATSTTDCTGSAREHPDVTGPVRTVNLEFPFLKENLLIGAPLDLKPARVTGVGPVTGAADPPAAVRGVGDRRFDGGCESHGSEGGAGSPPAFPLIIPPLRPSWGPLPRLLVSCQL